MHYLSVAETAMKWDMSESGVRNYCAQGKIPGSFLTGKTWNIPENAEKPDRKKKRSDEPKTLLDVLRAEQTAKTSGGIYHKVQIDLTYNSNHIEGSRLTHDQTRYIFSEAIRCRTSHCAPQRATSCHPAISGQQAEQGIRRG